MDLLSRLFKSVANDTRIKLLKMLIAEKELPIEEIACALKIPEATACRNLKILERLALVKSRVDRGRTIYRIIKSDRYPYNKAVLNMIERRIREER